MGLEKCPADERMRRSRCLEACRLKGEEESEGSAYGREKTYSVGGGEFLLGRDGGARALSCVQSRLALDDRLARSRAAGSAFAADLGDGVPILVRHSCRCFWIMKSEAREEAFFVGSDKDCERSVK